jgi:hypothetical protein
MNSSVLFAGALAGALVAAPALAQNSAPIATGKAFQLTPYAGYVMFGNFIDGPLGTSLSRAAGPLYGAQLGITVSPGVQLVGNFAYSDGDLRVGVPFLGGFAIGRTKALIYDGSIQLDLPVKKTSGVALAPFIQAGAGAIRWDIDLGNDLLAMQSTNLAANLGAGIDVPISTGFSLRLMAKDYIGKFDFKEAVGFSPTNKITNNWALTAGVRLDF